MKSALVIGSRSMLGAQLCEQLNARGVAVFTAGRSLDDDLFFDLNAPVIPEIEGRVVDTVFHCAASFSSDSEQGVSENFSVNTVSAWAICALAKSLGARSVLYAGSVSSSYEQADPDNANSYGLSKGLAEQIFSWSLRREGIRFCSLRFSQIYDTQGLCCKHQPWFGRIVAYAARGMDLRMPKSEGVRNFIHVSDAADFMIRAMDRNLTGVLNIVHPESYTCDEIAEIAYGTFAAGGKIVHAEEKQPFRKVVFPDSQQAYTALGGSPRINLDAGIRMIKEQTGGAGFGPVDVL
ncbi:NAD(P)-dependent oxidoreductase [Pseudomonas sp. ML96]|uniref:NAD-dependent epimerase/dehydratase family protein n=1 Tax=Pseudomonas sp. ML96 TaxID=1523503 RepID=UPI0009DCB59B|nr:NAD(P)-dependent oxidoreductase [Pseudomonas sp. ML96]